MDVLSAQHPPGGGLHHDVGVGGTLLLLVEGVFLQRNRREDEGRGVLLGGGV